MSYPLTGKIALVTGASKGIGKSIAENLSAQGATVVINYSRDPAPADALVAQLGADRSLAIKADVGSVSESQRLVSETVTKYGRIDILVLNAGVSANKDLAGTTEEDFDQSFDVNVKGPYFITQVCILTFQISCSQRLNDIGRFSSYPRRRQGHLFLDLSYRYFHNHTELPPLRRDQGRNRADDPCSRERSRSPRYHGQLHLARPDRDRAVLRRQVGRLGQDDRFVESDEPDWDAGRGRESGRVFGRAGFGLGEWAEFEGEWGDGLVHGESLGSFVFS